MRPAVVVFGMPRAGARAGEPPRERSRGGRAAPGPDDPLSTLVVLRELLRSEAPLTEPELRDRTLLPDRTVRDALRELAAAGLVTVLTTRGPGQRRYTAAPSRRAEA